MIKDIFVSMAASLILDAVRRPKTAEVGKVSDTLPIKPGSRVSQYWAGRYELDDYTGRPKRLQLGQADATEICLRYGLHSIEFGNWVNDNERQNTLLAIDESLSDLAEILGVSLDNIGLNGSLAIAFGARGKGGSAAAHYEPGRVLINLTKTVGPGSLAHEYGHALDYHKRINWVPPSGGNQVNRKLDHIGSDTPKGMIERAFEPLFWRKDGVETAWIGRLRDLPEYWNRRNEIWARIFEQWTAEELRKRSKRNHFLTSPSYKAPAYLPPSLLKKAAIHILNFSRIALDHPPRPVPNTSERAAKKNTGDAIKDVISTAKYKGIPFDAALILWLTWSKNLRATAVPADPSLDKVIRDHLLYKFVEDDHDNTGAYMLNSAGVDFIQAIKGRLTTFRNVAEGADLFPEEADISGIGDAEGPDIDTAFI